MKRTLKWPILMVGVFLTAFFINTWATYAEGKSADLPLIHSVKDAVARVDGKDITEEELRAAVNNVMPMQSFHTTVTDKRFAVMRKKTLEDLINNQLIYNEAVSKNEASITDQEFKDGLENLKKRLAPGDTIEKALERSQMTMDELRKDLGFSVVVLKYRTKVENKLQKDAEKLVTEKYMKDYYQKNLEKFRVPAQVHLRGILLRVDPSASQRVWNKAKKDIMKIAEEAKAGADFAELAKKHSQSIDASKGGDMGWAHEGSLLPDIEGAVSRLKQGEISGPVTSIYGVHLFKLEGKRPSKQIEFEKLNHAKLRSELVSKESRALHQKWIKDLRKNAKVEYLRKI